MKKFLRFSFFVLLIPALLFSSCKKDTETPERKTDPEFQALTAYMAANSMDLSDVLASPWYLTAASIKDNLNDYFIIDLRGIYDEGHIPGAVSATLTSLLDVADDANGKPIIVACFSGQSAGHAVTALRLSGYSNAASVITSNII